jgi:hypothetical protein
MKTISFFKDKFLVIQRIFSTCVASKEKEENFGILTLQIKFFTVGK